MRAAATELSPQLGQQLVIENKGGASGILAGQACAQAAPDGHTFCVIIIPRCPTIRCCSTMPYDADADFIPVARLFLLTEGLFVWGGLSVNSVAELKALAQAKPEVLNFATLDDGSFPDLFRVWLNSEWNTRVVGVPYKGGGPAAQALTAGEVQMTRFSVGNFMGALAAGKVKALAIHAEKRSPHLPDVPTYAEAGLNYPGQGWWGLAAPKGTPAAAIAKTGAEFGKLFQDSKFIAYLEKQSVVVAPTTPEGFAQFLTEDRKAAENLIKIAKTPKTECKQ